MAQELKTEICTTLMIRRVLPVVGTAWYSPFMARKKKSDSPIARYLAELRRSHASGIHGSKRRRDRYNDGNKALGQEKRDNHGE